MGCVGVVRGNQNQGVARCGNRAAYAQNVRTAPRNGVREGRRVGAVCVVCGSKRVHPVQTEVVRWVNAR